MRLSKHAPQGSVEITHANDVPLQHPSQAGVQVDHIYVVSGRASRNQCRPEPSSPSRGNDHNRLRVSSGRVSATMGISVSAPAVDGRPTSPRVQGQAERIASEPSELGAGDVADVARPASCRRRHGETMLFRESRRWKTRQPV